MLSPQALIRGLVQRARPSFNPDSANNDVGVRLSSYGEVLNQPLVRKSHNLADEGSYFVANNAQTAITPTYGALVATSPFIVLQNQNTLGQRLYLDYVAIIAAAAGTFASAGVMTNIAVVVDNVLPYTS